MTDRPTFESIYMNLAKSIARRSTCLRLNVGAVITTVDFRKVLAVGYNGNAVGLPNTCDSCIPGQCACIHAEANAIVNCDAPRGMPKTVFLTDSPCTMCAKLLINLGDVRTVYYAREYRIRDSLELLRYVGVEVRQFDEACHDE